MSNSVSETVYKEWKLFAIKKETSTDITVLWKAYEYESPPSLWKQNTVYDWECFGKDRINNINTQAGL
jgi:hypothetical protein